MSIFNFMRIIHYRQYTNNVAVRSGFLLIEIMIAVFIASIMVCILTYWQGNIISLQADALKKIEVIARVRSTIEQIMIDDSLRARKTIKEGDLVITWQEKQIAIVPDWISMNVAQQISHTVLHITAAWPTKKGTTEQIVLIGGVLPKNRVLDEA